MDKLNNTQVERYHRQIILPRVGEEGQKKLLSAKVLIIGLGGLGSPVAIYLTAAGVGKIGIVDSNQVELSNLHRQILYTTENIGKDKVLSAKERLSAINSDIEVVTHKFKVDTHNIQDIIKEYDIIIDCSDNFPTRYLVNDACVLLCKPLVHGSVLGFEGHALTILPHKDPCYRCLFSEIPPPGVLPTTQQVGIFAPITGIIGTIQANEVLKYILGIGNLLLGKLLVFNVLDSSYHQIKVIRNSQCPICGENPTITELTSYNYTILSAPR